MVWGVGFLNFLVRGEGGRGAMRAHISSFVILCRPQNRAAVRASLDALSGVEVHHCGEDGKIVAVSESEDEYQIGDMLTELQSIPGVIAANMVYHGIENESA